MSFPRLPLITLPLALGAVLMTGACAAPIATGASYAADGGFLVASSKTSTDHLLSMVSKQDCAMWRVIKGRAVCRPREGDTDPYKVDYNDPQRMVSEDGVQYAPPLRPAADAPAASWDAAAYKAAPPPAPEPPAAPVTAVAETTPEPQPKVASAPTPPPAAAAPAVKPAKKKTHSVKKPSRNPAAPAS